MPITLPNVAAVLALAQINRDVTAHRTVFGLVAGIGRDVATSAKVAVVGRPVVDVCVRPTPGEVAVLAQPYSARTQPPILMRMSMPRA